MQETVSSGALPENRWGGCLSRGVQKMAGLVVRSFGFATALMIFVSGAAMAQDGPRGLSSDVGGADRVVVSGVSSRLNIRASPTLDGNIVDRAPVGTTFGNGGCETHGTRLWCSVVFLDDSGRKGWAAAEFLKAVSARSRAEGGEFDQIGKLDCLPAGEADWSRCDYGVARGGQGAAALVVYLSTETEPLLLWDGAGLWFAGETGDVRLETDVVDGVFTVSPEGHGIRVPLAVLTGS